MDVQDTKALEFNAAVIYNRFVISYMLVFLESSPGFSQLFPGIDKYVLAQEGNAL
jgi:hypothetical protein